MQREDRSGCRVHRSNDSSLHLGLILSRLAVHATRGSAPQRPGPPRLRVQSQARHPGEMIRDAVRLTAGEGSFRRRIGQKG